MARITCPSYGKHQCFLGSTGTGKSELALKEIDYFKHYVIVDTQESIIKKDATYYSDPRAVIKNLSKKAHIVYRPKACFRNKLVWNWFFQQLNDSSHNQRGKIHPLIIFIDEIYQIGYGPSIPSSIPQGLATCRQRHISYWIATQRPTNIPIPILTECTNLIVFYLKREDDKKYVASFGSNKTELLDAQLTLTKDLHNFIILSANDSGYQAYPAIKL